MSRRKRLSWWRRAAFLLTEGMILATTFQAVRAELEALAVTHPAVAPLYESLDRIWRVLKNGEHPSDL